jgi:dienelactone hydrolase
VGLLYVGGDGPGNVAGGRRVLGHPSAAREMKKSASRESVRGIRAALGFRSDAWFTARRPNTQAPNFIFLEVVSPVAYDRIAEEPPMPDETPLEQFTRSYARKLREADAPPKNAAEWEARRKALHARVLTAIGPVPEKPCDLEPRNLGTLERDGYRIEKLVFQSRPDVWVTASAYVPKLKDGEKVPAVLAVHGHWAGARRDPVVQARCLGLVKLGFFVLVVDAFGSGERYTKPARGTYHGSLYGATLWPTGHTLLGMQVYDNRRAVDYLLTRKEVNGKLGITGASGGGNQSMNSGALDDRIAAVVPVCSVGNYQAYLRAACCVCEVMPNALTFTEEGDVLGLVAPRALLVVNASRDAIQFSPAEAEKSLARAKSIYDIVGAPDKVRHVVFDSGHDYSRPMREAMYGWMTLHLKGEGKGDPIPEPEHQIEKPEDLACYPDPNDRPKGFLTPPLFAGKVGRELTAKADRLVPNHPEMWEATANGIRAEVAQLIGPMSVAEKPAVTSGAINGMAVRRQEIKVESDGIPLTGAFEFKTTRGKIPGCLVVHLDGQEAAQKHAASSALVERGYSVLTADLRATGASRPKSGAIAGAPDHTPAEHGVWIGRPLLGQWTTDARVLLGVLANRTGGTGTDAIVGIGPGALVAILAASGSDRPQTVVLIDPMVTLVTDVPYASGTPMGILAPGLLKAGDVPHLAGLVAPRRLIIAGGLSPQGKKLTQKELETAFQFTTGVYKATKAPAYLTITTEPDWGKIEL